MSILFINGSSNKNGNTAELAETLIGWKSGRFANKGRAEAHVIEILTEATPLPCRAYLRNEAYPILSQAKRNWIAKWPWKSCTSCLALKSC